jgi:hypothetical protein
MRTLCVDCEKEFKIKQNGVVVKHFNFEKGEFYKLTLADLWECPKCHHEIVCGYGEPFYNPKDILEQTERAIRLNRRIIRVVE